MRPRSGTTRWRCPNRSLREIAGPDRSFVDCTFPQSSLLRVKSRRELRLVRVRCPNAFWVPLAELDFSEGAPVKKLTMAGGNVFGGDAASKFEPAEPFA